MHFYRTFRERTSATARVSRRSKLESPALRLAESAVPSKLVVSVFVRRPIGVTTTKAKRPPEGAFFSPFLGEPTVAAPCLPFVPGSQSPRGALHS